VLACKHVGGQVGSIQHLRANARSIGQVGSVQHLGANARSVGQVDRCICRESRVLLGKTAQLADIDGACSDGQDGNEAEALGPLR
jgi:hypothetical protein